MTLVVPSTLTYAKSFTSHGYPTMPAKCITASALFRIFNAGSDIYFM